MSALTALGAQDGELRSYLDIANALRQIDSAPKRDLVSGRAGAPAGP